METPPVELALGKNAKRWLVKIESMADTKYVGGYVDECVQFLVYGDALRLIKAQSSLRIYEKAMVVYLRLILETSRGATKSKKACAVMKRCNTLMDEMRKRLADIKANDNSLLMLVIKQLNTAIDGEIDDTFASFLDTYCKFDELYWPIRFKCIITFRLASHGKNLPVKLIDEYFMSLMMVGRAGAVLDTTLDVAPNPIVPIFQSFASPEFDYSLWISSGPITMFLDSREMIDEIIYAIRFCSCYFFYAYDTPMAELNNFYYDAGSKKNMWNRIKRIHGIQNLSNKEARKILCGRIDGDDESPLAAFIRPF